MRAFRRPRDNYNDPAATEFMWGVPRREGHSDTDDPTPHSGVMQHAFEFGRDDRAICGFEPPKRTSRVSRDARPQLAVPGRNNPKCRKCELLVASSVRSDGAVAVMDPAARDGQASDSAETDPANGAIEEVADLGDRETIADDWVDESEAGDEQASAEVEQPQPAEESASELPPEADEEDGPARASTSPTDEAPNESEALDFDGLGGARDPGFHPRSQADRARRRSVRRGGTVLVGPGRRSVLIDVPISTEIAGIVANVEPEVEDVRVEAVTVGNDGTARVTLNRSAPAPVEVAWYIVSNPLRESA